MSLLLNRDKKLEIKELKILDFLEKNEFLEIPFYQRYYKWDKEQIENLLDDLIARKKDGQPHYFGVIAKSENLDTNQNKDIVRHRIIDGQQRISTSILLIHYFKKHIDELDINLNQDDQINGCFARQHPNLNLKYEITTNDSKVIEKICQNQQGSFITLESNNNIAKNYEIIKKYFNQYFAKENISNDLSKFEEYKKLLEVFNHNFIFGVLSYPELIPYHEMIVFQNLNSRGMPLSDYDLIKNTIVNYNSIKSKKDGQKRLQIFNQSIINLMENGIYTLKHSEREKNFESFIEDFLKWKSWDDNGEDYGSYNHSFKHYKIYKNFKNYLDKCLDNSLSFDNLIESLKQYFLLYLQIKFPNEKGDIGNNLWLRVIKQKDIHIPLVFYLYSRYSQFDREQNSWINEKTIERYMQVFSSHLIKIMSVQGTGQSFFPFVAWFIKQINQKVLPAQLKSKLEKWDNASIIPFGTTPDIELFNQSLLLAKKSTVWISKSLIDIIETQATKFINERIDYQDRTIEHIMPKTPNREGWKDLFNVDNYNQEHEKHLNQIGNLIYLARSINSSSTNKSFNFKRTNYYQSSNSPLITSKNLKSLPPLINYDRWDFNSISQRTKILGRIVWDFMNDLND